MAIVAPPADFTGMITVTATHDGPAGEELVKTIPVLVRGQWFEDDSVVEATASGEAPVRFQDNCASPVISYTRTASFLSMSEPRTCEPTRL